MAFLVKKGREMREGRKQRVELESLIQGSLEIRSGWK